MRTKHIKITVGILALLSSITVLYAGGFLLVSRTGQLYRWDASTAVPFNPDRGMLGLLTNTEAVDLVAESFDVWNGENIPTSSLSFANAGFLSQDIVTEEDFSTLDTDDPDGISPIVFDVDGSIFEALGFPPGVIGFAGPEWFTRNDPFFILEGRAMLNGKFLDGNPSNGEIPGEEFLGVMAHEFGHYLNLGHSQVNGHFFIGDRDDPGFAEYGSPPIESVTFMFPLFVPTQAPATDDIRAISTLYPALGFPIEFGTIQGRVFTSNGVDQFQGANVVVRNVDDPFFDAGSMVSGELFRPLFTSPPETPVDDELRGFYRANGLTNGASYTVEVVNINPRFARGSSVGPLNVPVEVPGNEEFWNGEGETGETSDDPLDFEAIVPNGPVIDVDVILNEPPFTLTLDKFDVDNFRFILSVQSLISTFDTASGSDDYAAVRFSVPASVVAPFTVTKGEFFNNDDRTTWPRVLLTTPNENDQPDLENPLAELNDVVGPESAFMSVPFDVRRESFEDLFFVIQFPPGEAISAAGSGGGPALGGDADLDIGFREFVAGNLFSTDGVNFRENITSFETGSIPVANWAISLEILPDTTEQDGLEPNNDMATATAINFGDARRASIDPATDVDYFVFTGSAGDTISANVDAFALNSTLDAKLTLLNALGDTVAQNDNESQEAVDPLLQTVLSDDGDFFLVMESVETGVGGPEAFYDIHLNTFSPPF
ncbi:hypothetical protein GWO43_25425, partial [candidate division KSB1 bacterium]|nr:hypothetical protein [candidate division KSB1 bacterium]NIR68919.1 hypothetical protein [candidate division KSB1 bacterium]NIS27267.1 hypothetical protein [candidate division KSB1 bacterium]NIT74152.1 hypothetical protein [candidate division KSB1 bacterium]NIU28001.1 hypothetical protein [candidate division KSB1 bacterium]